MVCKKCQNSGVYNEILGKGFYYCRTCKEEITLEDKEVTKDIEPKYLTQTEIDELFNALQNLKLQLTIKFLYEILYIGGFMRYTIFGTVILVIGTVHYQVVYSNNKDYMYLAPFEGNVYFYDTSILPFILRQ